MATGIGVDDLCITQFQDLKLKKKYRYIVYRLSDDCTQIIVDKAVEKCDDYDEFVERELPEDDCRYAIYDFEFTVPDGGVRNKICFINW